MAMSPASFTDAGLIACPLASREHPPWGVSQLGLGHRNRRCGPGSAVGAQQGDFVVLTDARADAPGKKHAPGAS